MGTPELPGDPGEEDLRPTQLLQHPPLPSDDNSDNETMDYGDYSYQPLSMDAEGSNILMDDEDDEQEDENTLRDTTATAEERAYQGTHGGPNMPAIETADAEIERTVWSQPRPQVLQLELDNTRSSQIINAMANFTLPNVAVPDWAEGVPEERWKEELLQRIRQRKEPQTNE